MYWIDYLFVLGVLFSVAVTGDNYFKSPAQSHGKDPVLTLGETQLVSWETSLDVFNVTIWQQSRYQESAASKGNIYSKIHANDQITNFTWVVQLYGFDLDYSNLFFLWINPDGPNGFTSTFFNISEPSATSNAAVPTATSTSTSISAPSASSGTSSHSTNPSPRPSELTTTGKIAIGVGAGLGVPILCALGILIWINKRRTRPNTKETQISAISAPVNHSWPTQPPMRPLSSRHPLSPPKEMHGNDLPGHFTELPSQSFR
ncbi:hypothetical protein N7492_007708 [Penicillium capsulatum]|uniref:Mid2 domain-containing protein n=1 Tax=Penicillium capsulatum TaxID=69766 RepID=A0A9W9LMB9_9EURO|nr:hypothetical protein N7492_007708 [Penicillium capsulatum]KAJ6117540.1 hypothetical protein N7512_007265 [Penicillium capsulatum]